MQKGVAIPNETKIIDAAYPKRLKEEEGFKEKEDKLKELADKAKEQYKYKYASP